MVTYRRVKNVLAVAAAAAASGIALNSSAQVNEPLSNWNLDAAYNTGEVLASTTPSAPIVTYTEGNTNALVASFSPVTLSLGQSLTFSGTIAFPSALTGGIQFRAGIMNPGASNSPPPPTTDTGWLGYLAEFPNATDGIGNLGARVDIASDTGNWASGTGLVNLADQVGTAPGVNAPGIGTGATPITNSFTITIAYNGGAVPSYFTQAMNSTDGTYNAALGGEDSTDDQTQANNVYSEVGFLFGGSMFGGSFTSGNTNFTNLAVTLGPAPLYWNNSTPNGTPADGMTWDKTNNYNWNDGDYNLTYTDGAAVTFNDSNNGAYNVTLSTTVNPTAVTVNNSSGNYVFSGTGGKINDTGAFTKKGTGTLTVGTGLTAGSLTLSAGEMVIAPNTTLGSGAAKSNINISSLTIAANDTLDITNNHIIISYGATDPMSVILGYLSTGYNNGGWNGTGIVSSTAATENASTGLRYGIGWADGADGTHAVAGLSSGSIELKYTLLGDANLDGSVNGTDFSILAANFGLGVTNWDQGNFLFGSSVNGSDFSALAANFGQGDAGAAVSSADIAALDAFAAANGLSVPTISAVPEPATLALLGLGSAAMLVPRRGRQSGQ